MLPWVRPSVTMEAKELRLEQSHQASRADFLRVEERNRGAEFPASQNFVCFHIIFPPFV